MANWPITTMNDSELDKGARASFCALSLVRLKLLDSVICGSMRPGPVKPFGIRSSLHPRFLKIRDPCSVGNDLFAPSATAQSRVSNRP